MQGLCLLCTTGWNNLVIVKVEIEIEVATGDSWERKKPKNADEKTVWRHGALEYVTAVMNHANGSGMGEGIIRGIHFQPLCESLVDE